MRKFIKSSDAYKYVTYQMDKNGSYYWEGRVLQTRKSFKEEREAALFVDKVLINKGKKPVNILTNSVYSKMLRFITEISEALTDKMKGGASLSVLETSMYVQANEILKQVK